MAERSRPSALDSWDLTVPLATPSMSAASSSLIASAERSISKISPYKMRRDDAHRGRRRETINALRGASTSRCSISVSAAADAEVSW